MDRAYVYGEPITLSPRVCFPGECVFMFWNLEGKLGVDWRELMLCEDAQSDDVWALIELAEWRKQEILKKEKP